mmetsp:Transcript_101804/g.152533  ORF Transcript_101804/g.152533 Transcript_101804/m.152533 type:complete len:92 (-) Transcript_101804:549-824(-)
MVDYYQVEMKHLSVLPGVARPRLLDSSFELEQQNTIDQLDLNLAWQKQVILRGFTISKQLVECKYSAEAAATSLRTLVNSFRPMVANAYNT